MGMTLTKTFIDGQVTTTYHRIGSIGAVKNSDQTTSVQVCSYITKASKDAGKAPINCKLYNIPVTKAEMMEGNVYEVLYEKLMTHADFDGAEEL